MWLKPPEVAFLADFTAEVWRCEDEAHLRLVGEIWGPAMPANIKPLCRDAYAGRLDALRNPEIDKGPGE